MEGRCDGCVALAALKKDAGATSKKDATTNDASGHPMVRAA